MSSDHFSVCHKIPLFCVQIDKYKTFYAKAGDHMTIQKIGRRKKAFLQIRFFVGVLPTLGILFCMLLFLRDPTLGREAVLRGLRISALNVLPSVFPFLVFSDLLISGNALPKGFSKVLQRLFRLPAEGCTAILLGWVCGFPVGARCAATERKNGLLSADQAERAVAIACVPSPAFLIGGVGVGLFGDRSVGLFLYATAILSATTVGVFSAFRGAKEHLKEDVFPTIPPLPDPFAVRLTNAVRNAAHAALYLCAYIVFFSAVGAAAEAVLSRFGAPDFCKALVSCFLELSKGVTDAAALPNPPSALLLCTAAVGWTGLSVHFQTLAACDGSGLRFGRYFFRKGLQALLCVGLAAIRLLFT